MTTAGVRAAPDPATNRSSELVPTTAIALAVAVLALARQSGLGAWRTLWAEDGAVWLPDVWNHGWETVFRPSAGYSQLSSRLLAIPAGVLPVRTVAIYCALVSAPRSA
jgi:hypothetical protein